MSISLEKKKNHYLHYLLSSLRTSELQGKGTPIDDNSKQQLERTYKKALADYQTSCAQLEAQTESASNDAIKLRTRLNEKEDKAEKLTMTLLKYREDVAKQTDYANGKPFGMDQYENLQSQDMGEELERERLRHITNKVNVAQLEEKLRQKNELAGGVSDIEFNNLKDSIASSDKKISVYDKELENMNRDGEKLLKLEAFLTTAIQNYTEKNLSQESDLKDLNDEIEERRTTIARLNKSSQLLKKKIGYDANDIGAFLQTRMVNDDFSSSKEEIDRLHAKLNGLVLQHTSLVETN